MVEWANAINTKLAEQDQRIAILEKTCHTLLDLVTGQLKLL
jgi:hypothetical protein